MERWVGRQMPVDTSPKRLHQQPSLGGEKLGGAVRIGANDRDEARQCDVGRAAES